MVNSKLVKAMLADKTMKSITITSAYAKKDKFVKFILDEAYKDFPSYQGLFNEEVTAVLKKLNLLSKDSKTIRLGIGQGDYTRELSYGNLRVFESEADDNNLNIALRDVRYKQIIRISIIRANNQPLLTLTVKIKDTLEVE